MVNLLVGFAVAVLGLAAMVRVLEPKLAFFPSKGEMRTPAEFGVPFERSSIRSADDVELHAWFLPHPEPRAHVLYFHGNGGNLSVWAPIVSEIQRRGYSVRAIDYRGYGLSTGRPSEKGLYRDVDAAVAWARDASPRGAPVIFWGRSLGATMAAYAATLGKPLAPSSARTRSPSACCAARALSKPKFSVSLMASRQRDRASVGMVAW